MAVRLPHALADETQVAVPAGSLPGPAGRGPGVALAAGPERVVLPRLAVARLVLLLFSALGAQQRAPAQPGGLPAAPARAGVVGDDRERLGQQVREAAPRGGR